MAPRFSGHLFDPLLFSSRSEGARSFNRDLAFDKARKGPGLGARLAAGWAGGNTQSVSTAWTAPDFSSGANAHSEAIAKPIQATVDDAADARGVLCWCRSRPDGNQMNGLKAVFAAFER